MVWALGGSERLRAGWSLRDLGRDWPALTAAGIVLLIGAGAWLVYQTGGTSRVWPHVLYVPVLLAAGAFGVRAAVGAAVLAGLAIGPFMPLDVAGGVAQTTGNWLTRLGAFVVIAMVAGGVHRLSGARMDALEAAEAAFRALVQNSTDLIVVLDDEGCVTYASPSSQRLLGRSPGELAGARFADCVHPDDAPTLDVADGPLESMVQLRLAHADGTWRIAECVISDRRSDPAVAGVVLNARDVTVRRAVEAELRHRATHDSVTGLPARDHVVEIVRRSLRRRAVGGYTAVAVINIDRFKDLVDGLGPDRADALLAAVTARLEDRLRPGDVLGRYGMNELVLCCEEVADPAAAVEISSRLLNELDQPFMVGGDEVQLTAHAGVAAESDSGVSAAQLLKDAYAAMRHAVRGPRTRSVLFRPEFRDHAAVQIKTQAALRRALDQGQLVVHYQPIVRLPTAQIVGFEALVRWEHPDLGLVAPAEFIPLAEETGLIVPIGGWVLEQACAQLASWNRGRPPREQLHVAVNVSGVQISSGRLTEQVATALRSSRIDPGQLSLEITETILVAERHTAHDTLRALRSTGVRIAVDDFGTGYSSLAYLHDLPLDTLKIDRTFIRPLATAGNDDTIVSAIVGLARNLKLATVAEGIETDDHARTAFELGADFAQGYLYTPPLTAEAAGDLLRENPESVQQRAASPRRPGADRT